MKRDKGLIVFSCSKPLSDERVEYLRHALEPIGDDMGMHCVIAEEGAEVSVQENLKPLVKKLDALTQGIAELVAINADILNALIEEEQDEPENYLDGKPLA